MGREMESREQSTLGEVWPEVRDGGRVQPDGNV